MSAKKKRVAVIGGSIAGCATARVFQRGGFEVDVYERSAKDLEGRGAGIVLPIALQNQLIQNGFLMKNYAGCALQQRDWIVHDKSHEGRTLWQQAVAASTHHWGALWRALRVHIDDDHYHNNCELLDYHNTPDGVRFRLSNGQEQQVDLLVAADGYRSKIRACMPWGSESDYAGYVLWRGNFEESRVVDRSIIKRMDASQSWLSVCYEGGHSVVYMIPGLASDSAETQRRVNWAIYTQPPVDLTLDEPKSVPEGCVDEALYSHLQDLLNSSFPPQIADLIRLSPCEEVSLQPIYDELAVHFCDQRVMLVGDAAAVVRPHTASGATKALEDALTMESLFAQHDDLDTLLEAYAQERLSACNALVDIGRRIGKAQVEGTPDWSSMSVTDFGLWNARVFDGQSLYLYADDQDA
ncbi:MAG: FAD-dependent monooxygenase [Haliea sp.]|nr:FAD-dependent monooxygenase [Haliea sp.]